MSTILLSAGLGWVAGMRSATAPAVLSSTLALRRRRAPSRRPAHWLASQPAATLLGLAAVGEWLVDKHPDTPNRTWPPALAGRIVSGAFAGAVVASARRESFAGAMVAGAVGALASSFAMMAARQAATGVVGALPAAAAEDALALGLGQTLARRAIG